MNDAITTTISSKVPTHEQFVLSCDQSKTPVHTENMASVHLELLDVFRVKRFDDFEKFRYEHVASLRAVRLEFTNRRRHITTRERLYDVIEEERTRRTSLMKELLETDNWLAQEMMETNTRLCCVHMDLMKSFRLKKEEDKFIEEKQLQYTQNLKEMVNEEIQRNSARYQIRKDVTEEQREQTSEFFYRHRNSDFYEHDQKLTRALQQIQKLLHFHQLDKENLEREVILRQEELKTLLQEELHHKHSRSVTRKMSVDEQKYRLTHMVIPQESQKHHKALLHEQLLLRAQ